MASEDAGVPPSSGEPPASRYYKPTDQAFTKGTSPPTEEPPSDGIGGGGGGIAPLLPLQGRLLASLIASSLTGLSLGARILLTIATVIFIVREMVETRRDWYSGNASLEQTVLFRVQQQRESAEILVAHAAAKKTLQEELTAIVQREAASLQAMKDRVSSDSGDTTRFERLVESNSTYSRVYRYGRVYDEAKKKLDECEKNNNCSEVERHRLVATVDLYFMLTQDARSGYRAMTKNEIDHPRYTQDK